jgi:hypothetical protein
MVESANINAIGSAVAECELRWQRVNFASMLALK